MDDALQRTSADVDQSLLKSYQSLVGSLLYCAVNPRPDIAYPVGMLCRAMGNPTPDLYIAALRVLYYLKHHSSVGLYYTASVMDLSEMSDANWATRFSTSGYVFLYSNAAISWASKNGHASRSLRARRKSSRLVKQARRGLYLSCYLSEMGFPSQQVVELAIDNSAARDLTYYNPEHRERRTKHIERRHFHIRDMVESGQLYWRPT